MSPFDVWIINELIKLGIVCSQNKVQAIIWFPVAPYSEYSCAVRLEKCPKFNNTIKNTFFEKLDCVGNYVNLTLKGGDIISKVYDIISFYICKHDQSINSNIIVEHTSLTPVYPINLATFRSSAVGNALVSIYREQGANVSVHYLVSDTARNVDLILKKNSTENLFLLKKSGKNDHTCGALFCRSLESIGKISKSIVLNEMFPYSSGTLLPQNTYEEYNEKVRRVFCEFCLLGHIETLRKANIFIDVFEYESDMIQIIDNNVKLELESILKQYVNSAYLIKNYLYYSILSQNNCSVFSVVSCRQYDIIKKSVSLLKNKENVFPVFFNDVVVYKNNRIFTDSIKEGVFHSVDKYVDDATSFLNVSSQEVSNALKLLFLSVKNSEIIKLDYHEFTDLKKYIDILYFAKNTINEIETTTEISLSDIYLSKKIIVVFNKHLFGGVIKTPNKIDDDIYNLVACFEFIIQFIKIQFYESKLPINQDILYISQKIISKILRMLGVEL